MINIKIYSVTELATNCCLLTDEKTGKMAVSDPGDKSDSLIADIKANGNKLEYVMLTHGHYDHIGFAKQLAQMFNAKIVCGKATNEFLSKPELNLSAKHGLEFEPFNADVQLANGDSFMLGETKIKYITTPGHTSGCGCYIFDETIICGDTLFRKSYGRTDLPTGNDEQMIQSLKKLKELEGDYTCIPGHGPLTSLEYERSNNYIMKRV
ncbi:MAG: MBL fold metallo-hydrolase [Ruminococcus sp.]|nr:MBL fold metallo-hydrolase [Ruminococcus sp.]